MKPREESQRLGTLVRRLRALRAEAESMQEEIAFLDRFSERLPASQCAAAGSYLTMIQLGADLATAQIIELKSILGRAAVERRAQSFLRTLPKKPTSG